MVSKKLIHIKELEILIIKKPIKHIHLNVLPTEGKIRVSAPENTPDEVVRAFVISKLSWIRKQVQAFQNQERQTQRLYVSGESHYLRGHRYLLRVEFAKRPRIEIKNKKYIYFYVPPHYSTEQKRHYFENWLRKELKKDLEKLVPKWEQRLGVQASEVRIKKMKTKWGSCQPEAKRIWINLELIKKPQKYLEYIIAHELTHLIHRKHDKAFKSILDEHMPNWEIYKQELNEFIL